MVADPHALSLSSGARLAMVVASLPLLCCGAALLSLTVLRHDQAALATHYATLHLAPWPASPTLPGAASGFLHGMVDGRDLVVRDPAPWRDDIAMRSFFAVPALLAIVAAGLYGAAVRNRSCFISAVILAGALVYSQASFPAMVMRGWEIGFDAPADRLTLNGRSIAPLSSIERFAGWSTHRRKGGDDWHLAAVLFDGRSFELTSPLARPDEAAAAAAFDAMLVGRVLATPDH